MAKEIERKFLVKGEGWRSDIASSSAFLQAYVASGEDRSVRIRIRDGKSARLTIKIGRDLMSRDEFEYEIPLADAKEIAENPVGIVLEKTRHEVKYAGHVWEIDVYDGAYKGLIVAEVEMDDVATSLQLPEWIGPEITGDRRYSNLVMATEDLSGELIDGLSPAAG